MDFTPSQNTIITNKYNLIRMKNKDEQNRRLEEIYVNVPEIEALNKKLVTVSFQAARKAIDGDRSELDKLNETIAAMSEEKRMLLVSSGYPADYLDDIYDCPVCKDTGYIDGAPCKCLKKTAVSSLYCQPHLADVLKRENFETFDFDLYDNEEVDDTSGKTPLENIEDVVDYCHQYIKNFESCHENILFYGQAGIGKTFLINCIAKELIDQAFSVIYLTAHQLFAILEGNQFHNNAAEAYITVSRSDLFSCDLLIIDDLGTEFHTAFTTASIFDVINERLTRRKSTIISTNLGLEDLQSVYTDRFFSRAAGNFRMIRLFGDDIRIKKSLDK